MLFSLMNSIINVKFKIYSSACRDMRSIIMVHDESTHHHNFRTTTHGGRNDDRGVVVWCVCLLFSYSMTMPFVKSRDDVMMVCPLSAWPRKESHAL